VKEPLLPKDIEKSDGKKKDGEKEGVEGGDVTNDLYLEFKTANKSFWTCFLIAIIFLSIGLTLLTLYAINLENAMDCGGLLYILYAMILFHMVNLIVAFIALVGLEVKVCTNNACCFYVLYVLLMVAGLQVSYFNAQGNRCFQNGSIVYMVTFVQILIIYLLIVFVVCHLFRKNCQVPEDEEIPEEILEL